MARSSRPDPVRTEATEILVRRSLHDGASSPRLHEVFEGRLDGRRKNTSHLHAKDMVH